MEADRTLENAVCRATDGKMPHNAVVRCAVATFVLILLLIFRCLKFEEESQHTQHKPGQNISKSVAFGLARSFLV